MRFSAKTVSSIFTFFSLMVSNKMKTLSKLSLFDIVCRDGLEDLDLTVGDGK